MFLMFFDYLRWFMMIWVQLICVLLKDFSLPGSGVKIRGHPRQ